MTDQPEREAEIAHPDTPPPATDDQLRRLIDELTKRVEALEVIVNGPKGTT